MSEPIAHCIDCGCQLVAGPRGGNSVNMACPSCLQEYNIGFLRGVPVLVDRMGKLGPDRADIYASRFKSIPG